jgi:hypothetical protein
VYVIAGSLRVQHSKRYESRVRLPFISAYSPECNPGEYLNNHLKKAMKKKGHARSAGRITKPYKAFYEKLEALCFGCKKLFCALSCCFAACSI